MSGSGTIAIRVSLTDKLDAVCTSCHQGLHGPYVAIEVADQGCGMSPALLERIFEPFFSTKEVGKGSGMGLSTVHGITHQHDGHIIVDTAPGKGTTVRVLLPPVARPAGASDGDAGVRLRSGPRPALNGRLLLVDDDSSVAEFVCDLLESWGLAVCVCSDAASALATLDTQAAHIDAAMLDQTMPGTTGLALAQQVLARCPSLPVVLYSGQSDALDERQVRDAGIRALLRKPLDSDRLHRLLDELLSAGSGDHGA